MHRIDVPSATVDDKFTEGSPTGGVPATTVSASWLNDVQEELISILTAAGITPVKGDQDQVLTAINLLTSLALASSGAVIGTMRNARMSVAAAAVSGVFAADEIIVSNGIGGRPFKLFNFSKTINLSTVGAGGMDVGAAPASGHVSIYAIYNPDAVLSATNPALLACNQTTSSGPAYTGANMPAGYTASALVSAWRTTAGGLLGVGEQVGRKIGIVGSSIVSTTVNQTNSAVSIAALIPIAAKSISGVMSCVTTASAGVSIQLASNAAGVGGQSVSVSPPSGEIAPLIGGIFSDLNISEIGVIYLTTNAGAGALSANAGISEYTI